MTMIFGREGMLAGGEVPDRRCRECSVSSFKGSVLHARVGGDKPAWSAMGGSLEANATFQAAHSPPSRRFLGDGPYQSGTRIAGFWQTGLLAANGSGTFPAFIFKNALAAYNGIADYRLPIGFFAVFSRDPGWG